MNVRQFPIPVCLHIFQSLTGCESRSVFGLTRLAFAPLRHANSLVHADVDVIYKEETEGCHVVLET